MSEGAGAALSATSGRGLLPLCGGLWPPGAGVFSSPQLQICGLSSVAVEGLGAVLHSISGVAEAVPKPLTTGESPLQPPRSATKSTGQSVLAVLRAAPRIVDFRLSRAPRALDLRHLPDTTR